LAAGALPQIPVGTGSTPHTIAEFKGLTLRLLLLLTGVEGRGVERGRTPE